MDSRARIAIIDDERTILAHLRAVLEKEGYRVETAEDGEEGLALVRAIRPDLVLLDIVMPDPDGLTVCRRIRTDPGLAQTPVIMLTARTDTEDVDLAFAAGADDYVKKPFAIPELLGRLRAHLHLRQTADEIDLLRRDAGILGETTAVLASADRPDEILFAVARHAAAATRADRCTVVRLPGDGADHRALVATSDDPEIRSVAAPASVYPELELLRQTPGSPLLLPRVEPGQLPGSERRLDDEPARSLFAFPLEERGALVGTLTLAYRVALPGLSDREQQICSTLARIAVCARPAAPRGDTAPLEATPAATADTAADASTVQRLKDLERFEVYFENAAEAMLILGEQGTVESVNQEGESVLGRPRVELVGCHFSQLFAERSRPLAEDMIIGFRQDEFPRFLDMYVRREGDLRCLSVSTAALSARHGNAMVSLRDVTALRTTEEELRRTKEFLENLIDGSLEGIVAWDVDGGVLLFNKFAERITGLDAEDLIGQATYEELFPKNMAHEITLQLRGERFGGTGRLESIRKAILGADGEPIPINLTATIVYEDGEEAATVAIFSDLRDRLAMEKKLSQAQERLVQSERQTVVAELAGTAAHELNQPLTSVMGYAELLLRKIGEDSPNRRAVEIIFREAERMAGIVRKIGKITRYETRAYVGSTRIVDLERSSEEEES